ncbi:MAG: prolipoprotein diacylglyceryl transferase [Dehalococcoidia bacterium]|nr:prolipoprotein diacylglyceryl transferase [Dehalococcoidia bacterium]MDH4292188.1 prolipoprotein diacylglyceryl transferase [Dehalococcoidia bacterium]
MLTISVDPVAFTIGSLQIRWYGILVAVAVASVLVITLREAKKLGITRDIYSLAFWSIVGGLVGGRLAYVIYDWPHFVANPLDIFGFQGLAQNGMVIGIVVAALIYMRVTRMRFPMLLSIGDAVAVGTPLALAIGRIGCTLNGCCSGQPSPFRFFPLAVTYTPRDAMAPQYWNTPLYFTEFYHLLWNLIVFAIVLRFRGKLKPEGSLLFFFFCLFAAGDFAIRFLRTDIPVLWGLRQAQVLDLAILAVFLPWLIIRMRRFKKQALVAELANEAVPEQSHED